MPGHLSGSAPLSFRADITETAVDIERVMNRNLIFTSVSIQTSGVLYIQLLDQHTAAAYSDWSASAG